MTYNPGDALLGNGRRVKRGDTGTVGAVSNDRRGNNGDDSIGLFEWFVVNVCRVIVGVVVWTGINPLWKWLNNQKDNVNLWICDLFWMRVIFVLQNFATVSATKKRIASNAHTQNRWNWIQNDDCPSETNVKRDKLNDFKKYGGGIK